MQRITEPQSIRARILHYASQPKPDKISSGLTGAIIGEIEMGLARKIAGTG